VSDGDLMEGVASEAASLAGHLKLGKLICLYDDNRVTLSAGTDITFSEVTRCTCSFCAKRGALLAYCEPDRFHRPCSRPTRRFTAGKQDWWRTTSCIHCGCATFSDSPAFEPDGKWDGSTRRIGVNARLFDDFDAALASIVVIDGKHVW
jgi:hypothetical protein